MRLYLLATPIGNLEDITIRALSVLRQVDLIVCEDTRVTQRLLTRYKITKPLLSFHQHSKDNSLLKITSCLQTNQQVAYVTDAGTPGISDPGGLLVEKLYKKFGDDLEIVPLPGPAAAVAALSVSGFPVDRFIFMGFVPHKKGRQTFLRQIDQTEIAIVCYESVHRINKFLQELIIYIPQRKIMLARELTKKFERIYRGYPNQVAEKLKDDKVKGEFVLVIAPKFFE